METLDILGTRLERQSLLSPLKREDDYLEFFRPFQPVSTVYFTRPGDPPSLSPRTAFDDTAVNDQLRAEGRLLKGRFVGGGVGYVTKEDFETYANAFVNPILRFTEVHSAILQALRSCGPLAPRQLKEETGYLSKQIGPALNRLQTAFLVFEDQSDGDWERPFALMEDEREISLDASNRIPSLCLVIERFLEIHVAATREQIIDWLRLPKRVVDQAIVKLRDSGEIHEELVEGVGNVFLRSADRNLSFRGSIDSIHMLHLADPIVRAERSSLNSRFPDREILQYLLVNGEICGVVTGHWRIGPHDVEDIDIDLGQPTRDGLRDRIIDLVADSYHPPRSKILRYCGERIDQ